MIKLVYDPHSIQAATPAARTFVAEQVADYIPLRQFLYHALNDPANRTYEAILRHPLLKEWVQDLREHGPYVVDYQEISLREHFKHRFGFSWPPQLSEEALVSLQVLTLPVPYDRASQEDPTGWLLGERVAPIWRAPSGSHAHLADLAAWASQLTPTPSLSILEPLAGAASAVERQTTCL